MSGESEKSYHPSRSVNVPNSSDCGSTQSDRLAISLRGIRSLHGVRAFGSGKHGFEDGRHVLVTKALIKKSVF